jgi:mono/diheme cytochrome c family protein
MPALALALTGCTTNALKTGASDDTQGAVSEEASGAQLWAENCSRCHNIRPPQSFSNAQWQTITHHMRLRANLTGQETRTITEFLQSSN